MSEGLIAEIEADPELASLLKLNEIIQKVKNKNEENCDKIKKLDVAFKQLGQQINTVFKEQNASVTVTAVADKKKDDKKK